MGWPANDNRMESGLGRSKHARALLHRQSLRAGLREPPPYGKERTADNARPGLLAELMRIAKVRSRRRELFGENLFGEPAWDILLTLFGSEASVDKVCAAAGVPHSTALRWLNLLESLGWVERGADSRDHRRSSVRLTEESRSRILRLFGDRDP